MRSLLWTQQKRTFFFAWPFSSWKTQRKSRRRERGREEVPVHDRIFFEKSFVGPCSSFWSAVRPIWARFRCHPSIFLFSFIWTFSAAIALRVRHDFFVEITESVCGNFVHQAEITMILCCVNVRSSQNVWNHDRAMTWPWNLRNLNHPKLVQDSWGLDDDG